MLATGFPSGLNMQQQTHLHQRPAPNDIRERKALASSRQAEPNFACAATDLLMTLSLSGDIVQED